MNAYRMLVLTDAGTHFSQNAIYELLPALRRHPACVQLDVASRHLEANRSFFGRMESTELWVTSVDDDFAYHTDGRAFSRGLRKASLRDYDWLFMRLPRPIAGEFWDFLAQHFPTAQIINRPDGISASSSKAFLLQVPELCPPLRLCTSIEDVEAFKAEHPIVLKPLENYGGQGLIRIEDNSVWLGRRRIPYSRFREQLARHPFVFLGMKYLSQVVKGDKRIVVINGQVLGAALRLPPRGSWLCNAAQGGRAIAASLSPEEEQMAGKLTSLLSPLGIVFFGFDTLEDDSGQRLLSEVNTLSVGGLPQIQQLSGRPVLRQAADLIWTYVNETTHGRPDLAVK